MSETSENKPKKEESGKEVRPKQTKTRKTRRKKVKKEVIVTNVRIKNLTRQKVILIFIDETDSQQSIKLHKHQSVFSNHSMEYLQRKLGQYIKNNIIELKEISNVQ
jgi:hypothetical protein